MKILAVRLAEVGCFSAPVALEGLSGGLNVLAGANEAGKSTILAALRLAFEQSHTQKNQRLETLRPYGGGAPLIEVDFSVRGATWRLRKRYLASKSAELRNLATGQIARGADAEQLLADLLADAGGRATFNLLWAAQKEALTSQAPDDEATTGLKRAIATEIAATVGGSEARNVRTAVRKELEAYVTAQRGQPRGEYDAAIKLRKRLISDLEIAVSRRDAALTRLDRLADLKVREAELDHPAETVARTQAASQAEAAAAQARDALQKHRVAADAVTAAENSLALARNARDRLAADIETLATLAAEIAVDQDTSREIASRLADAEAVAAEAREARDAARHALTSAERELKAALHAERRQDAQRRLAEQTALLAAIDDATQAGLALRARLDAMPVTADLLRQMRAEDDAACRLEDRLSAAAPKLTIAYAPGGAGRVTQDGAPLAEGAHVVEQPITLHIEGVGTITLAPGASNDVATTSAAIARHRARLSALLSEAGVVDVAAADVQFAARQALETEIGEARARLGALTPPGGIAKLKSEIETLGVHLDAAVDEDIRPRSDIEREIEDIRVALKGAEPADEAAQRAVFTEREAAARHAVMSADRLKRAGNLEDKLPPQQERDALTERHAAAVTAAERALHAAVRELAAWRDQVPDAARLSELEAAASRAAEAVRAIARQLEETRRTIASLEGELRADRNDDVEARVAELQGALALATARVTRMEEDVAALQLLDAELRNEEMRSRDQYLRPITDRLVPLIDLVFPGADVTVAENFAPASLRRTSEREAIAALSEGTQEQIAVMVRLAFGRLMADAGNAIPVILDDALVYSDDERILRMFAALIKASQHHQVIVFTCRSRAFGSLDGHRLSLAPWHMDADVRPALSIAG
jgi:hypothetical protein